MTTSLLRNDLISLTSNLIRYVTTADRRDELGGILRYIEGYLDAAKHMHICWSENNKKPALVATFRNTRTPALMLNGHVDVVPGQPDQFEPRVRNGRLYGRGSQDMKGSVAVLMRLLVDLARLDEPPDIGVQFVTDEEIGGENGTGRLLKDGWRCGFFLVAEPTDLRICYEQKGILWARVEVTGMSAHGSRPWQGRNPVAMLGRGIAQLAQRFPPPQTEIWCTTVTPTALHAGGSSINQIPDKAVLNLDIRYVSDDDPDEILDAIQKCFPDGDVWQVACAEPLVNQPDEPGIKRLAEVIERVRGTPTDLYREHFGSDARFYSMAQIPAICFGPVGDGLHSQDEWVDVDSLVELYTILYEYCLGV